MLFDPSYRAVSGTGIRAPKKEARPSVVLGRCTISRKSRQTGSSFAGRMVPGHLARLVRPVRAGPALAHFAAGSLLVAPAYSGFLPARHFGAFAHPVQAWPVHLVRPPKLGIA